MPTPLGSTTSGEKGEAQPVTIVLSDVARLDDPKFYMDDPYPVFARLRRESPIYRFEGSVDFWALTKWSDIKYVSDRPDLFSSTRGLTIFDRQLALGLDMNPGEIFAQHGSESLIHTDPPRHAALRRLTNRAFTPRMVAGLEQRVREVIGDVLDGIDPEQPFDFVERLAVPIPLYVIGAILGIPRTDWGDFQRWSDAVIVTLGHDVDFEVVLPTLLDAYDEMWSYFATRLAERAGNPCDDLMSRLVSAELNGERLSQPNQVLMCISLLVAGNETTRNLLSAATFALAEHPDQKLVLISQPVLIGNAVEEFLRWAPPLYSMGRTVTENTEIRGQPVEAGDYVLMLYQSANRDEDVWDNADVFDVTRQMNPMHLAFGWGEHSCIGMNLARLEIKVFFEEFLARFPDFELNGEVVRPPSLFANTITEIPLVARRDQEEARRNRC